MKRMLCSMLPTVALAAASTGLAGQTAGSATAPGQSAPQNARPCDQIEEHGQFDFWVGEWDVVNAQGGRLGTNSITKPEQECMLVEHWESATGNQGTSINYFDPETEQWVQYWVAATWMLNLSGNFEDGAMRMEGRSKPIQGEGSRIRGTWTPLEDGRVRQVFESWNAETDAWQVVFDGYYARRDTSSNQTKPNTRRDP